MRNRCKLKTIVKVVGIIFAIAAFSNLSFTVNLSNNNGNNRKIVKENVKLK